MGMPLALRILDDIEVVKLVRDRKGKDGKVRERSLGLQGQRGHAAFYVFYLPEGSFTNNFIIAIEQAIDGMKPKVGHA